ncbi:hypothetical protein TW65_05783 [Stemphylium lycopersici]|nr:hypothetical protein TW65_05783 [Stemphylium lycopersici]
MLAANGRQAPATPAAAPGPSRISPPLDDEMLENSDSEEEDNHQNETLVNQLTAQIMATPNERPKPPPKMATPEKYDGGRTELRTFLTTIELYCEFHGLADDQGKILMASMHMKGKAASWMQPFVDDYLKNPLTGGTKKETQTLFISWTNFKEEIGRIFGESTDSDVSDMELYEEARLLDNATYELLPRAVEAKEDSCKIHYDAKYGAGYFPRKRKADDNPMAYGGGMMRLETQPVSLDVVEIRDQTTINIMDLGEEDMLIGYDWLIKHNLAIDWLRKTILGREPARKVAGEYDTNEFRELFEETEATELAEHQEWDHEIYIQEGAKLVPGPMYLIAPEHEPELREYLRKNLSKRFIREMYSKGTLEEYVEHVKKVLRKLKDYKLYLQPEKYALSRRSDLREEGHREPHNAVLKKMPDGSLKYNQPELARVAKVAEQVETLQQQWQQKAANWQFEPEENGSDELLQDERDTIGLQQHEIRNDKAVTALCKLWI